MRYGYFRVSSTLYDSLLGFGEFEMIVIPIGLFFALHREKLLEKCSAGWLYSVEWREFSLQAHGALIWALSYRRRCSRPLDNSQGADDQDELGAGSRLGFAGAASLAAWSC